MKTDPTTKLKISIEQLKSEQALKLKLVKEELVIVADSLNPIAMIKNSIKDLTAKNENKSLLVDSAIGMTMGYVSKIALLRNTHNPLKKIIGNALQFVVTAAITRHPEKIKSAANFLIKKFSKKKDKVATSPYKT